jgi:chitodextrinase
MSKKARKRKSPAPPVKRNRPRKRVIVVALILLLSLSGLILAQWRSLRTAFVSPAPVPQTSSPQLSKEYIYAGGKLIATEEPSSGGGSSTLPAPSALTAIGSDTSNIPQVILNWTAPTGSGTVNHYIVERMQSLSAGYTAINQNVTTASYTDTSVSANTAYLYRVRAVDSSNNLTTYSNVDLATTITFTDDPLVGTANNPNPATATTIRATHFEQLRTAINAVRTLANETAFNWTTTNNPAPQSGGGIYKSHLNDLRANLKDAFAALGLSTPQFTAPDPMTSGQFVRAIHLQELRDLLH